MYGDGGSRTRVQKLQYSSFYACSLPICNSRVFMPTPRTTRVYTLFSRAHFNYFYPLGSITYLRTWFKDRRVNCTIHIYLLTCLFNSSRTISLVNFPNTFFLSSMGSLNRELCNSLSSLKIKVLEKANCCKYTSL